MKTGVWCSAATALTVVAAVSRADVWLEFESPGAAAAWTVGRGAQVTLVDAAPAPSEVAGGAGPAGRALRFAAPGGGGAYLSAVPDGLASAGSVALWVRRVGADAPAAEVEVHFVEPDGRSRFWRKITLEGSDWRRVEFPLRFFRTTGARVPDWREVRHFGLHARQAVTMDVDAVSIERIEGYGPEISLRELRDIAFPSAPTGTVRLVRDAEYAILTDAAGLDLLMVRAVMAQLTRQLRRLFPFLPPPSRPPVLLVFAKADDYRSFPPRIAERMGSTAREPTSDGYTIVGVATSWWDAQKGSLRPVFFHEFVHAWLSQAGGLACEGHWLHEAVANFMQLSLFPQPGFDELVRRSLDAGAARPLRELCSERPVRVSDYWQLVTVFRMLVSKPPYSERLPKLFEAARAHSSFDLGLYLAEAFGVDWDQFVADWTAYCDEAFPNAAVPSASSAPPAEPAAAPDPAAPAG